MTPANPIMSGSPGAEPLSNPPLQRGFFSRIGAFLKTAAPYIAPIADRLAAAAGNYAPMEAERQQREDALRQQLTQSTLQNQDLTRQLTQKQLDNYQTPAQQQAAAVAQAGALERVRNENAPPTDIVAPMDDGSYGHYSRSFNQQTGQWEVKPTMVTRQVPNPAVAAQQATAGAIADMGRQAAIPSGPIGPPNPLAMPSPAATAPPPVMPPLSPTVPQQSQLSAMPKTSGAPQTQPTTMGSSTGYDHVWYANGREVGRAPEALAPAPYVGSTTTGTHNTLKQDENGNWVSVPESTSTTKTPQVPGAAAPPKPIVPSTPRATAVTDSNGNPIHAPLSAAAKKTIGQINSSEGIIGSIIPELDAKVKDIQSRGGDANSLWDSVTQRAAWAEYQHGGIVPSNIDPTLAKILPVIAQLQIVAAQPYMNNSRNFQFMQQIQQHIPNPEKDSPALMVEKIHAMQQTLPIIRAGIMKAEGVGAPQGNSSPATLPKVPPRTAEDYLRSLQQ